MQSHPWLNASPGEPVPIVGVKDLQSVWKLYTDIESRYPGGQSAVDIGIIEHVCTPGADIGAVTYRCGMLQILQRLAGDPLASWTHDGQPDDGVFRVAASIPMTWIGVGFLNRACLLT